MFLPEIVASCFFVPIKKSEELMQDDHLFDESEFSLAEKQQKDELLDNLSAVFDELKKEQKLCIQLFYLEKKSYEEVAQLTHYTLKEVKSHLQNGRRNLKILLEKRKASHGI